MGLEGSHCAIESGQLGKTPPAALVSVRRGTLKTACIPITGGPDQVFRLNGTTGGGTPTPTPTASPTATPTATGSPTASPSVTPSPTATPSATGSPTATPSATPSGTPTATPTPSATPGGCVRGQGYWKNHPDQWPVTELQLGNVTYDQQQLLDILHQPPRLRHFCQE
jgi:hypothetical protein